MISLTRWTLRSNRVKAANFIGDRILNHIFAAGDQPCGTDDAQKRAFGALTLLQISGSGPVEFLNLISQYSTLERVINQRFGE
jgi:hypothetical protein